MSGRVPWLAIAVVSALAFVHPARAANDATRRALAELKRLCDAGLVSPPVCLEKQRAILGLASGEEGSNAADAAPTQDLGPPQDLPFGVRVALPAGWTAVSADRVHDGFELLRGRAASNPEAIRLLDRLERQAGDAGVATFADGADSLRISRPDVQPPVDPAQARTFCDRLAQSAAAAAARPLRTYACGSRPRGPGFYVERDALVPGTRTMQAWVTPPGGVAVQLVLSCRDEHVDARRRELEGIVASLRPR